MSGTWDDGVLTVSNLPKYDANGEEWLYFFTETAIRNVAADKIVTDKYSTEYRDKYNYLLSESYTYSGGTLINIKSVKQLTVSKTVVGDAADYSDSFRFTVTLLQADQTAYSDSVEYTATDANDNTSNGVLTLNNGSATITLHHGEQVTLLDLPNMLLYTVEENAEDAAGYQTSYTVNGALIAIDRAASGTLSNNPVVAFTNIRNVTISGSKTWDDDSNRDGIRPASITVDLYAGDLKVQSTTVTAENSWHWNFTAPKYHVTGTKIV